MRLFFSFSLDSTACDALLVVSASIDLELGGRRVPAENLHVTLAFVGEVSEAQLPRLIELGASQCAPQAEVILERLAYWKESQVMVALIHPIPPPLAALAVRLNAALAGIAGARREERPWAPHVTLARKVTQPPVFAPMSRIPSSVRAFSLMKSERRAARSVYTVVDTWPLLDKSEAP